MCVKLWEMLRLQLLQCFGALPLLLLRRVRCAAFGAVQIIMFVTSLCQYETHKLVSAWLPKGLTRYLHSCSFRYRSGTATATIKKASFPVWTRQGECFWRFSSCRCPARFKAHLVCPGKAPNPPHHGVSWVREKLWENLAYFAEGIAKAVRLSLEKASTL